jgi:hypothetical protein
MSERTDIHDLLMLKLTSALNKTQQAEIDALIENDPEVAEAWKTIQQYYLQDTERKKHFDSMSASEIMEGVKERRQYYQPKSSPLYKLLIAAALIGVGIYIYAIAKNDHPSKVLFAAHKNISPESIYLELGNGDTIDLSGSQQYQSAENGQVTLNNSRNRLTFVADKNNGVLNKLVVPAGKEYSVRLADGTDIRMNAGSTLKFPFGFPGRSREIALTGEAYIKVATTPEQPFTVHTPDATIQVLGTEFNINTYNPGKATISLVEGAVKVKAGTQEVVLKPGFQADYTTQNGINTAPFDKNDVLSWLEGRYTFDQTPLREIIPILERWYDVKIISDNATVAGKTFKGEINKSEGIGAFLEMLEVIRVADYYYKNDTIHIK